MLVCCSSGYQSQRRRHCDLVSLPSPSSSEQAQWDQLGMRTLPCNDTGTSLSKPRQVNQCTCETRATACAALTVRCNAWVDCLGRRLCFVSVTLCRCQSQCPCDCGIADPPQLTVPVKSNDPSQRHEVALNATVTRTGTTHTDRL